MVARRLRAFRAARPRHARVRCRRRGVARLCSFAHRRLDRLLSRFNEWKCFGRWKTFRYSGRCVVLAQGAVASSPPIEPNRGFAAAAPRPEAPIRSPNEKPTKSLNWEG